MELPARQPFPGPPIATAQCNEGSMERQPFSVIPARLLQHHNQAPNSKGCRHQQGIEILNRGVRRCFRSTMGLLGWLRQPQQPPYELHHCDQYIRAVPRCQ
jgi:hypothetical protein